jgi:hypothetical protein
MTFIRRPQRECTDRIESFIAKKKLRNVTTNLLLRLSCDSLCKATGWLLISVSLKFLFIYIYILICAFCYNCRWCWCCCLYHHHHHHHYHVQ